MNHGFVLNDGASNIRSSYFPVSAVVVRDEPTRYHREEYYTGNEQPWSNSSNVSNSNHRVVRTTGGGNSRSPTSRRAHMSASDQRRGSSHRGAASGRPVPSYMAATASFQRKHQPEEDEELHEPPHDDDNSLHPSTDHHRATPAAVRGASSVASPTPVPMSQRSKRHAQHENTYRGNDNTQTPPPHDVRRLHRSAEVLHPRDGTERRRVEFGNALRTETPRGMGLHGNGGTLPAVDDVSFIPVDVDDIGSISAASSSTAGMPLIEQHARPVPSTSLGLHQIVEKNAHHAHPGDAQEAVPYWVASEAERRDTIDGEEDLTWILLMEDFMDGVAGVLCAPPAPAPAHAAECSLPSDTAAYVERPLPQETVPPPEDRTDDVETMKPSQPSHEVQGGAEQETAGEPPHSVAPLPPGVAQVDPSNTPWLAQPVSEAAGAVNGQLPAVGVAPLSSVAPLLGMAPNLNVGAMPPELQQYLLALHFQTVALSAEVKRVSETHQVLQSSLVSAQAEIMRLHGGSRGASAEASDTAASSVAHGKPVSHDDLAGAERGAPDDAQEVPIHPALLNTPPPPTMINPHDYTTVEEALAVEGTGNVVKSIYNLLSYPLQCCIRKPSPNDDSGQ